MLIVNYFKCWRLQQINNTSLEQTIDIASGD
jgi:hypothetical protein